MSKRVLICSTLALILLLSTIISACGEETTTPVKTTQPTTTVTTTVTTPVPVINLKFGSLYSQPHPYADADAAWIEKIEAETNGRVNIEYFPGQFFNIKVSETDFPLLRRPFSICDAVNNTVYFLFSIYGIGTYILSQEKIGDNLDLVGPLGNGFHYIDKHIQ